MKTLLVLCLFFALPIIAQDTEKKEPDALTKARTAYQKEVARVTAPVLRDYLDQLDALKKVLGGKGDADGAVAVQREIEACTPEKTDVTGGGVVLGVWTGRWGTVEFRAGGRAWNTYGGSKTEGTWTLTGKKVVVVWTNGSKDIYSYPPQGGVLSGTCSNNGVALSISKK